METGSGVALRDGVLLAAKLHRRHQPREHVLGVVDGVGQHQRVQRLQQVGHIRRGARVDHKRQINRGRPETRFTEQALMQRAGVQRHPVDANTVAGRPFRGGVPPLGTGKHRHVHTVREDGEFFRFGLGPHASRRHDGGHRNPGLHKAAAVDHNLLLLSFVKTY